MTDTMTEVRKFLERLAESKDEKYGHSIKLNTGAVMIELDANVEYRYSEDRYKRTVSVAVFKDGRKVAMTDSGNKINIPEFKAENIGIIQNFLDLTDLVNSYFPGEEQAQKYISRIKDRSLYSVGACYRDGHCFKSFQHITEDREEYIKVYNTDSVPTGNDLNGYMASVGNGGIEFLRHMDTIEVEVYKNIAAAKDVAQEYERLWERVDAENISRIGIYDRSGDFWLYLNAGYEERPDIALVLKDYNVYGRHSKLFTELEAEFNQNNLPFEIRIRYIEEDNLREKLFENTGNVERYLENESFENKLKEILERFEGTA